jgi:hypothetical protein
LFIFLFLRRSCSRCSLLLWCSLLWCHHKLHGMSNLTFNLLSQRQLLPKCPQFIQ